MFENVVPKILNAFEIVFIIEMQSFLKTTEPFDLKLFTYLRY